MDDRINLMRLLPYTVHTHWRGPREDTTEEKNKYMTKLIIY